MKWAVALTASLVVPILIGYSLSEGGEPNRHPPCYTIQEAKWWGCYVCPASCSPSVINWKGKQIVIKRAWLEKERERVESWNPFASKYKITKGYHLCLNVSKGRDELVMADAFFVLKGNQRGFGDWGVVIYEDLDSIDPSEYTVYLTDNLKLDGAVSFRVIPIR